ncbi:MAG TPA: R3H domain-containing nucleic acid-binding protein, partial [Tepidiformaceae bacterium]|nr:R3H domain-containing nucleic acid-binding protein [Tepidiformaceae bacterium]
SRPTWELGHRRGGGHIRDRSPERGEREHRDAYLFDARGEEREVEAAIAVLPQRTLKLFAFGIPRARLEQAARSTGAPIELVDEVSGADALITMRSYYRSKPAAVREAEERNLPMYVVKSNSVFQLEQVMLQLRPGGNGAGGGRGVRRDPMVDVFRETEEAIARVIEEGRPIELAPANSYVRRVQHQLATRYNLDSRSSGKEPQRRVRILPMDGTGV